MAPDWQFQKIPSAIVVRVPETLTETVTKVAVREFVSLLESLPSAGVVVIDIRALAEYDAGSRRAWQETIRTQRKRLRGIIFVSENPVFRMVGTAVGLFTGLPTRLVTEERLVPRTVESLLNPTERVA